MKKPLSFYSEEQLKAKLIIPILNSVELIRMKGVKNHEIIKFL